MRFIDSDFDGWWRDVGQFLPPCDTRSDADRKEFKAFAKNIRGTLDERSEELEEAERQVEMLENQIEKHSSDAIREILNDNSITSFDKITKLKKLYEDKT